MKKLSPVLMLLPLVLTGCQEWNGMFNEDAHSNYDTGYSHATSYDVKTTQNKSTDGSTPAVKKASSTSADQSGAAGAVVTTPASTERKGSGVPLDAPAVPSTAPTVGQ